MDKLRITAGGHTFAAHFETKAAPKTVAVFKKASALREQDHPRALER